MQPNPYAAPAPATAPPPDQPAPAGFWWRVVAELIDYAIFLPLGILALANAWLWHSALLAQAQTPLWILYRILLDARGGTVGKRAIRLRLVDAGGAVPGLRRAVLRNIHHVGFIVVMLAMRGLGYHAERVATVGAHGELDPVTLLVAALTWIYSLFCLVVAIFVAARDDKRGLHDLWSGVWCLRLPPRRDDATPPAAIAA